MPDKRILTRTEYWLLNLLCLFSLLISSIACPSPEREKQIDSVRENYQENISPAPFKHRDAVKLGSVPANWKPYKIAVEGDYSYVIDCAFIETDGYDFKEHNEKPSSLHIINNGNETAPVLVKSLSLDGKGWDIVIQDGYAYAATANGLLTIDVHKPEKPVIVDRFSTPDHATKVSFKDSFLYLLDSSMCLRVLHLKNPAKPVQIFHKIVGSDSPYTGFMEIDSEYIYFSGPRSGLDIYDLVDPVNPERVCYIDSTRPFSVVKYKNYLYAGVNINSRTREMAIFDLSKPDKPVKVGALPLEEWAIKLIIKDNRLYAFCADGSVPVYDLTDPLSPPVIGKRTTRMKTSDLWVDDEKIISIHKTGNYQICNFDWGVEEDDEYKIIQSINKPGSLTDFVLSQEHVFAVGHPPGIYIYYVADPSDIRLISKIELPAGFKKIAASDKFVYVKNTCAISRSNSVYTEADPTDVSVLRIYNINRPEYPVFVGSTDLPRRTGRIVSDGKILLGESSYSDWEESSTKIFAVDVSNPSKPVSLNEPVDCTYMHDFELQDKYLYAACGNNGLMIYQIETPFNLKLVSQMNELKWITGVAVKDKKAYVAGKDVIAIDITNPVKPAIIESLNTHGDSRDLIISNDYALVQRGMSSVEIVDLKDLSKKTEFIHLGSNQNQGPIAVKDEYVLYCKGSVLESLKIPDQTLD